MATRVVKLVGLLVAAGTLCGGEVAAQGGGFRLPPLLMETDASLPEGAVQGTNIMRQNAYRGGE